MHCSLVNKFTLSKLIGLTALSFQFCLEDCCIWDNSWIHNLGSNVPRYLNLINKQMLCLRYGKGYTLGFMNFNHILYWWEWNFPKHTKKVLIPNLINEKIAFSFNQTRSIWMHAAVNSQLEQIRANFWKTTRTNTHLSCKPDICEKTAFSEKFSLEIDLSFLENVNALSNGRHVSSLRWNISWNPAGGLETR